MYLLTSQDGMGLPSAGATPPKATDRKVRRFVCSTDSLKKVSKIVGKTVSEEALRLAIASAIEKAMSLTKKAIRAVEKSPRSSATRSLFREIFSTFPEHVPKWAAGASWKDLGGLVAHRLQRAVEVLASGHVQYYCWGCPGGYRDPITYNACNHPCGKYIIGFGKGFWEFWKNGDYERMGMILLHETLHVYFCSNIKDEGVGRYGNAYCYQRFVPETNGLDLYPETEKACASILRRGSRGREVRKLQLMLNHWIGQQPMSMSLSPQLSMLDETGIFDLRTEGTVRAFQEKNGLKADGVAGSETWRTLLLFNQ